MVHLLIYPTIKHTKPSLCSCPENDIHKIQFKGGTNWLTNIMGHPESTNLSSVFQKREVAMMVFNEICLINNSMEGYIKYTGQLY